MPSLLFFDLICHRLFFFWKRSASHASINFLFALCATTKWRRSNNLTCCRTQERSRKLVRGCKVQISGKKKRQVCPLSTKTAVDRPWFVLLYSIWAYSWLYCQVTKETAQLYFRDFQPREVPANLQPELHCRPPIPNRRSGRSKKRKMWKEEKQRKWFRQRAVGGLGDVAALLGLYVERPVICNNYWNM